MQSNVLHIPTIISSVVDSMRDTYSITAFTAVTGGYKVSTRNTKNLVAGDYVTISGNLNFNGEYRISSVVANVSFNIEKTGTYVTGTGTWTANKPYFIYGTINEMIGILTGKDKSNTYKFQKYPLIVLLLDIGEERGKETGIYCETDCRIWIANTTRKEWSSEKRTSDNFVPVLYPIYKNLIEYLEKGQYLYIDRMTGIPHKKTDRYYWGEDEHTTHVFNDYIDGIDLENVNLKFKKQFNSC